VKNERLRKKGVRGGGGWGATAQKKKGYILPEEGIIAIMATGSASSEKGTHE